MDTLKLTKLCEGLKSYVSRKRNENPKTKVKFIVTDGLGEEIPYEKEIPEYSIINEQLLNPEYIGYKVLVGDLLIKEGTIKEPKKIETPQQQTNFAYPQQNQQLENNMMQFMFQMMQQSNALLAESQKANMNAILDTTTKNAEAQSQRNLETFKGMLEIEQAKNTHALAMKEKEFKFELEKREALESIGKDSTSIGDIFNKLGGIVEKVPMPIWAGLYKKFTGQEMPAYNIPSEEVDPLITTILEEASN